MTAPSGRPYSRYSPLAETSLLTESREPHPSVTVTLATGANPARSVGHRTGELAVVRQCRRSPTNILQPLHFQGGSARPVEPGDRRQHPKRILERAPAEESPEVPPVVLGETVGTAMSGPTRRDQAVVPRPPRSARKDRDLVPHVGGLARRGLRRATRQEHRGRAVRLLAATTITTLRLGAEPHRHCLR